MFTGSEFETGDGLSFMVFIISVPLHKVVQLWSLPLFFMLNYVIQALPSYSSLSLPCPSYLIWCESCQLGKHSRTSFSRSVTRDASSPFALVHSDIWGPSRVKSTLGFQYFVTFIDDYSKCTWLFLMKHRSKLFQIFQSFFNEIKTQFGVSIRVLRSSVFLLEF